MIILKRMKISIITMHLPTSNLLNISIAASRSLADALGCNIQSPRPHIVERGFVKHGWVFGEWDCLLTEEDVAYVQPYQNYGIWNKIITPTIEQCKSILKAKHLRNAGMAELQEKGKL